MKAPFANLINSFPLVVPPSGKMMREGYLPAAQSLILSFVKLTRLDLSSFEALSKKSPPQALETVPTQGMLRTLALAMKQGIWYYIIVMMSIKLEWFATLAPAFSYDGVQSGPRYFL